MIDLIIILAVLSYCVFLVANMIKKRRRGGSGCSACNIEKLIKDAEKMKEL